MNQTTKLALTVAALLTVGAAPVRSTAAQPERPSPRLSQPACQAPRASSQIGALLRTAGQVARTIERAERGRFNLSHELNRPAG